MRAQATLEFAVSLLAIITLLTAFAHAGSVVAGRIGGTVTETSVSMKAALAATYCDLVYFNWKNIEIGERFDFGGVWVSNSTIWATKRNQTAGADCLSPGIRVAGGDIEVSGVKRWF